MIKCMPIVTAIERSKIAFHVAIVDAILTYDAIHTMYDYGGEVNMGKKVGEASLILQNCSETEEYTEDTKVLYLGGYLNNGEEFDLVTEKSIIEACKKAAKAIWG